MKSLDLPRYSPLPVIVFLVAYRGALGSRTHPETAINVYDKVYEHIAEPSKPGVYEQPNSYRARNSVTNVGETFTCFGMTCIVVKIRLLKIRSIRFQFCVRSRKPQGRGLTKKKKNIL